MVRTVGPEGFDSPRHPSCSTNIYSALCGEWTSPDDMILASRRINSCIREASPVVQA